MKPEKVQASSAKHTSPLRPLRRGGLRAPVLRKTSPSDNDAPQFPMRINKYLAWKKYATRRSADVLIDAGSVTINGRVAVLGDKVAEYDKVVVTQKGKQKELTYYAYYKPRGIITHSPSHFEQDILSVVDLNDVFPIGRLDKDSDGLIILTNDGRITERLLHPRFDHEKEYLVTTKEQLRSSFKAKMEAGVKIEKEMTKPCKVRIVDDHTFRVTLTEGKKHQIRRMCVALFQEVKDLTRIRVMTVELGALKPGQYRKLTGSEKARFLKALDLV